MAEDREKLILDIEVNKENASKDLKEFQKELDKTAKKEENFAKVRKKNRNKNKSKYKTYDLPTNQQTKEEIKQGQLIQKITDKKNKSLKETYKRYDDLNNEVKDYYKRNKEGELVLDKTVTNFTKKKKNAPLLEEITGKIVKHDTAKHTIATNVILGNNKKLINSYKNVKEIEGKFFGELTSSYEKDISKKKYKSPLLGINQQEKAKGKVLSYDSKNHTLQTEQILRNNKRIVRSYKDVVKEGRKFSGVLQSEKTLTKSKAGESNTGLGRIKRIFQSIIAFRLASAGINLFLNSFRQGIEALKQSGSELSKPFEKFNQATMAIKVSLGTIIIPLVQTLTSLLDPLSNKMIDLANAIAFNNAQAQGQTEYYKLSREKIDEYTKSLQKANTQLTQLDKFATLSGKKSFALGEVVNIDPNTEEGLKNIEKAKDEIADVSGIVSSLQIVFNFIGKISNAIQSLDKDFLTFVGFVIAGISSVVSPFGALMSLFASFIIIMSKSSAGAKSLAFVLASLAGAFLAVAIAKSLMKDPTPKGLAIAGAIGAGGAFLIGTALAIGSAIKQGKAEANQSSGSAYSDATSNSNSRWAQFAQTSSSGSTAREQGDVYIDGQKAGKILAPYIHSNLQKLNLI